MIAGNSGFAAKNQVHIALDAMGSERSPDNEILGAEQAIAESHGRIKVTLVGQEERIAQSTKVLQITHPGFDILNASEIIEMGDEPVQAIRQKRNSSIVRAIDFVNSGEAHAFVSAGNTGAVMSGATLLFGRITGVSRPTIGSQFPRPTGGFTLLFDVGATVDSKAIHLREYAIMGSIYASEIFGIAKPTVGLLSVGEESSKGNELVFESQRLLEQAPINFVGNVEGRDVLGSKVDVIVCDGFVGNIVLKFAESVLTALKQRLRSHAGTSVWNKIKIGLFQSTLKSALRDFDYQEYGGVPLLGVKHVTIIGHGSSTPKAIKNMILKAEEMVSKQVNKKIENALAMNELTGAGMEKNRS